MASNSRITVQQFVEDGYQELVDKRACNVYWDQFAVQRISQLEGEYFIEYGDMHTCTSAAEYIHLNVRWYSEQDYLAMQLNYAEKALEEAKNTLRLVHDLAQGAGNLIAIKTTDERIVLTLKNIDKWSFEQYLKLDKGY